MDEVLVEKVLRAVELVPSGRVISYGDIAALVGTGPRHVGTILRLYGANVTWWRVVNASGDAPKHKRQTVFEHWREEGIPIKPNGLGCRIAEQRVDLEEIARAHTTAVADLR
ncbi:MGMT family protein [Janibacter cremeus]|uniref:Alkylated DNA nucleotide flippase Atl1 n=1 Tax=Janibacter cremeus TaxID=1285192 RepID=A0A852VQT9_9MICO|nr:alkylated DNA nucleotide flippase Atl1 [Janibacter cremeus]